MQRAGTLRYVGPPRPGPLLNRPLGDKSSNPGKPSQANRGPKNRGRSWACREWIDPGTRPSRTKSVKSPKKSPALSGAIVC
jgi:hypothetical protein